MTLLAECGISDSEVRRLLRLGLRITANTAPYPGYLTSTSSDFVVQTIDAYTPPLTDEERLTYIQHPERFCTDLLLNIDLYHSLCKLLIRASRTAGRLEPSQLFPGALSSLMLNQSALDNHYYKYDAQIEFSDTPLSPVGHHWLNLQGLCRLAANNLNISDDGEWAQGAALAALESVSGRTASQEFSEACTRLGLRLAEIYFPQKQLVTPRARDIRAQHPALFFELRQSALRFRRTLQEFVDDSLMAVAAAPRPTRTPTQKRNIIAELGQALAAHDHQAFVASLDALRKFSEVQQEEGFRFKGVLPGTARRNADTAILWWRLLSRAAGSNSDILRRPFRGRVKNQINLGPEAGMRGLLALTPMCLRNNALDEYNNEMARWMAN